MGPNARSAFGQVFLTSKVSPYEQGQGRARLACLDILKKLGTDYVVRPCPSRAGRLTASPARHRGPT
jgi:hypothetical protein